MTKKLLIAVLLGISSMAQARVFESGFVVGNGGDGFQVGDQILLRDLVEMGADEKPFIASNPNFSYTQALEQRSWRLDFNHLLLSKKLADLDRISYGLGATLLEVILMYNWVPVTLPLAGIQEGDEVIHLPGNHVQIANRLGSIIRVHEPSWKLLPESHRVALFIHEALYSLNEIQCVRIPPRCATMVRNVREFTGRLFLATDLLQTRALTAEIPLRFRLPPSTDENPRAAERMDRQPIFPKEAGDTKEFLSLTLRFAKDQPPFERRWRLDRNFHKLDVVASREFCESLRASGRDSDPVPELTVALQSERARPFYFNYQTSFGEQQAVAWSRKGARQMQTDLPALRFCEATIFRYIRSLIAEDALLDHSGLLLERL